MMQIRECKCEHKYQDKVLGKFKRWMNQLVSGTGWCCTVCGTKYKTGTGK